MKLSTFKSRLEKLADKTNANKNDYSFVRVQRNSSAYKLLLNWDGKSVIRPCRYYGGGKYTSIQDDSRLIKSILNAIDVKCTFDNDAPRGGSYGNFIKVTTKIEMS